MCACEAEGGVHGACVAGGCMRRICVAKGGKHGACEVEGCMRRMCEAGAECAGNMRQKAVIGGG